VNVPGKRARSGFVALLVVLATCASAAALAQGYPNRPIRIIAPFPAGGGYDFLSRLIGQEMSKTLGQPIVVDNKSGANGNIGTDAAAKSPPDGYTLLMGGNSPLSLNVGLYPKLPYDPVKDFEPISRVATQPNLLAVHPGVPVKSLAELIQYAKANPGKLSYGSNGNGSPQHLAAELLKRSAGIEMIHVPYKGAAPTASALLAGEVSLAFNIILLPLPQVQAGRLTGIAVASSRRSPLAPELPTMSELGYPIDIDTWYGLLAPAGTPKDVVDKLYGQTVKILTIPEVRKKFDELGLEPVGNTPAEFAAIIKKETPEWAKVIKDAGIKLGN